MEVRPAINRDPVVALRKGGVVLRLDRMIGRPERQHIEQQRLAVSPPAMLQEPAGRAPAHRQCVTPVQRPAPVDPRIEPFGQRADLAFPRVLAGEKGGSGQASGDQQRRVDGREFAAPGALAGPHIEKVIVEAAIAARPLVARLRALGQEAQRGQHPPDRLAARNPPALDADGITGKAETGRRNTRRRDRQRRVRDQSGGRIGVIEEVSERRLLQAISLK
ncbi:hypothetical protein D9M70_536930 [compost metagenome]